MALGAVAYIALTVTLATQVLAPAARLSNQWDTRVGGLLADAIGDQCGGQGVRRRGARGRAARAGARQMEPADAADLAALHLERHRPARPAVDDPRRRDRDGACGCGPAARRAPGDVVYVLTAYFVLHGYLRDIGQHVHHLQRAVNEMEELALLHAEPLGVEDFGRGAADPDRRGRDPVRAASPSAMAAMRRRSTRRSTSPSRPASGSAWSAIRDRARRPSSS